MRNKPIVLLFILALFLSSCQKDNVDNNRALDFDVLNVNFVGSLTNNTWLEGDAIGVFATCTRNGEKAQYMSDTPQSSFLAKNSVNGFYFTAVAEQDQVIAYADDHNFKFHAYYPYQVSTVGPAELPVLLPVKQSYAKGVKQYGLYVASKQVTTIVPAVNLEFKSVFSQIDLFLPNDILDENGNSRVRSLQLKPNLVDNFKGRLADGGVYNLETGTFTSDPGKHSNIIELDFGTEGILLSDAFTKVSLAVAPLIVPEGGFDVVLKDMEGFDNVITILSEEKDTGIVLAAGGTLSQYLSRDNDGILPVTFPVVFPLGKINNISNFTTASQPRWVSEGLWVSPSQNQAYAKWFKASDPVTSPRQFLEITNSGDISSPGIKGIWTGDYLEFVLPVKKFVAGTALTMKFPMYTRQGPVFWNIEYLDGEVWKSNTSAITCYDAAYTRNATFSLIRGGKVIEHTMIFTQAIASGHVKVRVKCADGTIQADTDSNVAVRTTPWISSGSYAAPFYLYLAGSDVTSVSFAIN